MKRTLALLAALAALSACEMFGGGGDEEDTNPRPGPVPVSNVPTRQEYVDLFNTVKTLHEDLKITMANRGNVNTMRASSTLADMRTHSKRMAMMTAEPYSSQLMGIAEEFEKTRDAVTKGTWSQRHLADLDSTMRRFARDFPSGSVVFRDTVLPDTGGTQKTGAQPTTGTDPAVGKTDPEKLRGAPWALFKAWVQEHTDLMAAVEASDEALTRTHYTRVIWLLKELDGSLPDTERSRLARFRAEYEDADRRTGTFTRYPDDFRKEAALQSLKMAGDAIKLNFDPDRK